MRRSRTNANPNASSNAVAPTGISSRRPRRRERRRAPLREPASGQRADEHLHAARLLRVVPVVVQLRETGAKVQHGEERACRVGQGGGERPADASRRASDPEKHPGRGQQRGCAQRELQQHVVGLRAVDGEREQARSRERERRARVPGARVRAEHRERERDRGERAPRAGDVPSKRLRILDNLQRQALREDQRVDAERVDAREGHLRGGDGHRERPRDGRRAERPPTVSRRARI